MWQTTILKGYLQTVPSFLTKIFMYVGKLTQRFLENLLKLMQFSVDIAKRINESGKLFSQNYDFIYAQWSKISFLLRSSG